MSRPSRSRRRARCKPPQSSLRRPPMGPAHHIRGTLVEAWTLSLSPGHVLAEGLGATQVSARSSCIARLCGLRTMSAHMFMFMV